MRKIRMLSDPRFGGDGTKVPCALRCSAACRGILDYDSVEADRILPGGPYAYFNVQPACRACNVAKGDSC